jgi:hypothetical protein
MPTYNGHPSYNAWNVSLWIYNDEGLYHLAQRCKRRNPTLSEAAREFIACVGSESTPDSVKWTKTNVIRAMREL